MLAGFFVDVSRYNFEIPLAFFNLHPQLGNLFLQLRVKFVFLVDLVYQILLHLLKFGRQFSLAQLDVCYLFENILDGFGLAWIYGAMGRH